MLRGGRVRAMYELKGKGESIRGIARKLGVSRNTVRKYGQREGQILICKFSRRSPSRRTILLTVE
jgi:transposase